MEKLSAEDTLLLLMDSIAATLSESEEQKTELEGSEYARGMRAAFVEVLELLQRWEHAAENGLDWDIEETFPA